ncbi:B1 bradykinin receptor-like [Gigantopelta aegis]|uniref:B1 bradykinin receptor-like n=1 Tax=Gigantopelta aegis TaxID=1735272 RepID=UPI001B88B49C|nr:B1 bradykinin receptor-like [Gigantopelta aegis]
MSQALTHETNMLSSFNLTYATEYLLMDQGNGTRQLQILLDIQHDQSLNSSSTAEETILMNPLSNPAYVVMRRIQTVLIPVVCVVGMIGNILASGTFLNPVLRNTSCCLYLAAKSIGDMGFLLSLFVIWLYRIRVPFLLFEGVCHVTVFLTYVCGFLSVWFVVIITCENFIRISQHSKIPTFCTRKTALLVITCFVCFSLVFYSFSLWTTGVVSMGMTSHCTSLDRFSDLLSVMTYVDTTITLLLPSFIVVFFVLAIMLSAFKAFKRRQRLGGIGQPRRRRCRYQTPEGEVTKFLFALSLIFFLLHTPSHAIRIKLIVSHYLGNIQPTLVDLILQRIFELLLSLNFSVNCLLCYIFGDNFRKVFRQMYMKCNDKKKKSKHMYYEISQITQTGQSMMETSTVIDS